VAPLIWTGTVTGIGAIAAAVPAVRGAVEAYRLFNQSAAAGAESAQYWADYSTNQCQSAVCRGTVAVPGSFASLWTPETAPSTAITLGTAGAAGVAKGAVEQAGAKIVGTAQETGTFGHTFVSKFLAYKEALNPNTVRVTMDLGYRKLMEGTKDMIGKYGPRPDVGTLYKDGSVKVTEVLSKTDKLSKVLQRNQDKMKLEGITNGRVEYNNWAVWLNKIFGR
jgi:uncharacterized membrane protein